ncbi:MAG TPA: trypsin-like peptidase domain-containing protein, partial [Aestuariivirga sp.]|nr:trypsin-like peptidase domain-containing protein [Aestuariivirga sp.]
MPLTATRKTSRLLSVFAAGLFAATALTAAMLVVPAAPLHAETQAAIDPSDGFADLVDKVMPAVISVEVKFANVAGMDMNGEPQPGLREFFRQFPQFRDGLPSDMPQRREPGMAQGSGFIISADGYAVTNNHVVQNAEEVSVRLKDGEELKAEVIGTDPKTDLALIKIKSDKTFQFVKFADTEPRVGDWVVAVGNPFGLGGTVTTGIISARGRDIGSGPYDDFLQIDASINHGNSGGPAFNLEGDVIGINTAIFSPSGGSVGIGFAIPASITKDIVATLRDNGKVTRGWLGVRIQPVTEEIAE